MKMILSQDVERLGKKGEIVDVKPGFARNFILPQNLGHEATAQNIALVNRRLKKQLEIERVEKEKMSELARKIEALSVTITAKAGQDDKLFGSVTAQEIAAALKDEGVELDKHNVQLESPIRALGSHNVTIKLKHEQTATLKVWVVKE